MKYVASGWQFTVYDLENGRVRKTYNTWLRAYTVMWKDAIRHIRPPVIFFTRIYEEGKAIAAQSLKVITESGLEQWMFGNPTVISTYAYEQDYAESLSHALEKAATQDGKQLIDKAIAFVVLLYSHSLIEKNFNVADNFGIDKSGNIILIDLGEVCFEAPEIATQISKRVWAAPDVLSRFPVELREYFLTSMNSALLSATISSAIALQ